MRARLNLDGLQRSSSCNVWASSQDVIETRIGALPASPAFCVSICLVISSCACRGRAVMQKQTSRQSYSLTAESPGSIQVEVQTGFCCTKSRHGQLTVYYF